MEIQVDIFELFLKLPLSEKISTLEQFTDIVNVEQAIKKEDESRTVALAIKQVEANQPSQATICPHCESESTIKWGIYKGRLRYRCNSCNRTFTSSTGTCGHALKKKEKFDKYKEKMFSSNYLTISEMEKEIGISRQTAFDWRHKVLASFAGQIDQFEGITEIDDQWFLYSQKGRNGLQYSRKRGGSHRRGDNNFQAKVLITCDRKGALDMSLVRIGRLKCKDIQSKLKGHLSKNVVLVSDAHSSIKSFATKENIEHKSFTAKSHGIDSQLHVQHVNNIASRFDNIINRRLRGISTKFLQNYANWFKIKEKYKKVENGTEKIMQEIEKSVSAWSLHMNTESLYETFINSRSVRTYRCPIKRHRKSQSWNFVNAAEADWL